MSDLPCVLALDCGATSLRAMLVASDGRILARASKPNETRTGVDRPEFHVWDADRILDDLAACSRKALEGVDTERVRAVTVTTFGVDGAPVDASGRQLYPVISWKCPRTAAVMADIGKYLPQERLNAVSGVGAFAFNSLYKLVWLRENRPETLRDAHAWLFISSLLNQKLTGEFTTDRTMAGTSQMTDLRTGGFSDEILGAIGVSKKLFPRIVNAGDIIGRITPDAAARLGLAGRRPPVVSTGHDTQFAVFGSGAGRDQPVLSSGTWEILMVRSAKAELAPDDYADGATAEYDAEPGLVNPGLQWLGSGVLEWVKDTFYAGIPADSVYETMIREAAAIPHGCEGVTFTPDFLPSGRTTGSIHGLVLGRTRAHIYRAALEALSARLRSRLDRLETIGGFKAESLVLVGGATRNKLWTQLRADALGIPVRVSTEAETTVLGAAMFAFAGAGVHASPEAARDAFGLTHEIVAPSSRA